VTDFSPYSEFQPVLATPHFCLEVTNPESQREEDKYYRITGLNSAITCLLDGDANVLLVRQYRPSLETYTLEFPAGGIDDGEKPRDAARREIREETGYASRIFPLGSHFHLMMNRTNIRDYLFAGLIEDTAEIARRESGIDIEWVSRSELPQKAFAGDYRQLAGLGILQLLGGELELDMWRASDTKVVEAMRVRLDRESD